ncbi:peptide chain release factor N(5)-glutamine methyltransferase [Pelistega sp. NLN82]|uniref:Release factor glutamine methyltransferase n=1 Tax=Pelistega ratti TaxID=2652177 RepID=A0A6L9Y4F7_9BURK|nr:peptide chain release factor N(5)-glutamine methyltransferase [Pelistega ratti]NEN75271.1 peptide chain release factor N(5)-glutamine methyltransferase [Pelistega ratti]
MTTIQPQTLRTFFAQSGLPLLEAKMLVEKVLGVTRAWMITHDTDRIADKDWALLQILVQRRLQGEPMAYIVGKREFMGLDFSVNPSVLIPRPDTEILVETALAFLEKYPTASVLDMGTGSGAIALSIAYHCPTASVVASDVSEAALSVAKQNALQLNQSVQFIQSDWFSQIPKQSFHLIVSNPPYIHPDDIHLSQGDLRFEPLSALTDFSDGLSCYRTIIQQAPLYLKENGALYVEHGWDQAESIRKILYEAGFSNISSIKDLSGIERVSGGVFLV